MSRDRRNKGELSLVENPPISMDVIMDKLGELFKQNEQAKQDREQDKQDREQATKNNDEKLSEIFKQNEQMKHNTEAIKQELKGDLNILKVNFEELKGNVSNEVGYLKEELDKRILSHVQTMEDKLKGHIEQCSKELKEKFDCIPEIQYKLSTVQTVIEQQTLDIKEVNDKLNTCQGNFIQLEKDMKDLESKIPETYINPIQRQFETKFINLNTEINELREGLNHLRIDKSLPFSANVREPINESNPDHLINTMQEALVNSTDNDVTNRLRNNDSYHNNNDVTTMINNRNTTQNLKLSKWVQLKIFSGNSQEDPVEFINTFIDFFQLQNISESEKILIITQHLKKNAKDWWLSLFDKPHNFHDFKDRFFTNYWNEDRQDVERHRITTEKYSYRSNETLVDFFHRQVGTLKNLFTYDLTESQIIRIVQRNLPKDIYRLIVAAECHTTEEVCNFIYMLQVNEMETSFRKPPSRRSCSRRDSEVRSRNHRAKTHLNNNNSYRFHQKPYEMRPPQYQRFSLDRRKERYNPPVIIPNRNIQPGPSRHFQNVDKQFPKSSGQIHSTTPETTNVNH